MTRVSCYTNAPRSPLPRRAACFTSHRAARERFLLEHVESAAVIFLMVVGSLINPKTPLEEERCLYQRRRFFFPPRSPKSLPSTLTTPKSFFLHFFHSLLFSNFIFFACVVGLFVSLSLSLSRTFSLVLFWRVLHWYKIRFARC